MRTSGASVSAREPSDLATRIVDAAERRLAEVGDPAALSLRAIARDVGITAPAIYTHFPGKDDIVSAVLARHFGELDRALDAVDTADPAADAAADPADVVGPTTGDPRDRLLALCLAYCRFAADRPGRYHLLFGPDAAHYGVAFDGSPGAATFARLADALAAVGPPSSPDDLHRTASVLWSALHGTATLRADVAGFPWPPLGEHLDRLIDGMLPAERRTQSPE